MSIETKDAGSLVVAPSAADYVWVVCCLLTKGKPSGVDLEQIIFWSFGGSKDDARSAAKACIFKEKPGHIISMISAERIDLPNKISPANP
jgi:hypothetical protein